MHIVRRDLGLAQIIIPIVLLVLAFSILGVYYFSKQNKNLVTSANWNCDSTKYVCDAVNEINVIRKIKGLNTLAFDENLCMLSKELANDYANSYPQKTTSNLMTDPQYEKYLTLYESQQHTFVSPLDALVEYAKENNTEIMMDSATVTSSFTSESIFTQSVQSLDFTHACAAISDNGIGYKPFAVLIAGTKK